MPDLATLKKKAADLEQRRQFDKALAVYEEILLEQEGSDDADVSLLNRVGDLRQRLGRYAEAVDAYERAVELYVERGFLNNAIALCNKILRQDPTRASVHYRLGRMTAEKGFRGDAKRHFLEYADLMQRSGRLDEAFTALREFADVSPEHTDVRVVLAEQLAKQGRTEDAIGQLTIVLERFEAERRHADADAIAERIRALDPSFAAPPHLEGEAPGGGDGGAPGGPGSRHSTPARASNGMPELVLIDPTEYGGGEPEPPRRPSVEMPEAIIRGDELEVPVAPPRRSSEFERGVAAALDDDARVDAAALAGDLAPQADADLVIAPLDAIEGVDAGFGAPAAPAAELPSMLDGFEATEFDASALGGVDLDAAARDVSALEHAEEFDPTAIAGSGFEDLGFASAIPGVDLEPGLGELRDDRPSVELDLLGAAADAPLGEDPILLDLEGAVAESGIAESGDAIGGDAFGHDVFGHDAFDHDDFGDIDSGVVIEDHSGEPAGYGAAAEEDELLAFSLELDGRRPPTGAHQAVAAEAEGPELVAPPDPDASVLAGLDEAAAAGAPSDDEPGEEVPGDEAPGEEAPWEARLAGARALAATGDRNGALRELAATLPELDAAGRRDVAASVLDEMIALDPTSISLHQQRVERASADGSTDRLVEAHRALAVALTAAGQPERARAAYERLLAVSPSDGEARAAMASLRPRGTPAPERAVVGGAPAPAPSDDEGGFVNLGDLLRSEEAPRTTRMVVEEKAPTGDEQADFAEMLRKFKQGVAENVDDADHASHYDLGVAYKEMGLLDEAVAAFQRALRGTTHRARTYEALGQCFIEREQYAVASAVLQRALGEPGADDHQLVGVLYLLGRAAEAMNQRNEALSYYQRVFAVDIEFADVMQRMQMADRVAQ